MLASTVAQPDQPWSTGPMSIAGPTTSPAMPRTHLLGWDCIELWVGNARTTAGVLRVGASASRCTAYAGPETGVRRPGVATCSSRATIRFVVTGRARAPTRPIAAHVRHHGDGVHDLAWAVDDADAAFASAIARGARPVRRAVGARPTTTASLRPRHGRDLRRDRAHVRRPLPATAGRPRSRLRDRGRCPNPPSARRSGSTRDRPRRRQRRAGRARPSGSRFYDDGARASPSCCTSTTTRSAPSTRR